MVTIAEIVKLPCANPLCQVPHPPADITEARVYTQVCAHIADRVLSPDMHVHCQELIVDLPSVEWPPGCS